MSITRRFIILAALGLPLLALSQAFNLHMAVFAAYNAFCFGLLAVDFFISPSGRSVEIKRDSVEKMRFRAENRVCFSLRHRFSRPISITLKDEIPDWHFTLGEKRRMTILVPPGEEALFFYTVIPSKRGRFSFENVHGFIEGVLGLCRKYFIKPLPMDCKVYPDLRDLSKYRLAAQKRMQISQGDRSIKLRGAGEEFESLRDYVDGDDYRKMNWMATARQGKLIINQYQAERNQPVFILVDCGRPMSYTVKGWKKLDYAINAALILSDIVNQQGDNSALMVFDANIKSVIMPGKGEGHRDLLMEALYDAQGSKMASDYEGAFMELLSRQKRRGLAFLFTDFETMEEAREVALGLATLKKRHTPIIVLMENESLDKMISNSSKREDDLYEKSAAIEFRSERQQIIRSMNAKGIACIQTEAENFALAAVNRYLSSKIRG
ncbi:MAG: DUF58 domain-containing protein [Clostridiales bacterium]|jgi:uncharacterized protein (DUF58 family)|nr:DUF58 domain-containing protein [Clostridiales bacterium]